MRRQARETVEARPLGGYGLWIAVVNTANGRKVEGYGWSESRARRNAWAKAREARND